MNMAMATRSTPLLALGNSVYLKLEAYMPTGSVKHRMVQAALRSESGRKPGSTLVVPSSGNTAAAAAAWAKAHGHHCIAVVPACCPPAKRQNAESQGASVAVAPEGESYREHAQALAKELAQAGEAVWVFDQYSDPRNAHAYTVTLAPELAQQARQLGLDTFAVAATASTGGTLLGLARWFRDKANWNHGRVLFALAAPAGALRVDGASPPHAISLPEAREAMDMTVWINGEEAAREFAAHGESHNIGMSGAMALAAAQHVRGQTGLPVVAVCADGARNYRA